MKQMLRLVAVPRARFAAVKVACSPVAAFAVIALCSFLAMGIVGERVASAAGRHRGAARHTKPAGSAATKASAATASAADASAALPQAESSVQAAAHASSAVVIDVAAIEAEIRRRRGHPVILHFWASWCGPCLEELPLVNRFAEQLRASGAAFLSVSLDDPEKRADHVLALLKQRAPALTVAIARIDDPDRFIAAFHGLRGRPWEGSIPALFVFDKKGALVRQHIGDASAAELAALARAAGVKQPRARAVARKARAR